jgi:hypothetical protein
LRYLLGQDGNAKEWKTQVEQKNGYPYISIKSKLDRESASKITVKCEAEILLPKNILLKAITEMNLRAKWDVSLGDIEILEYDKSQDYFYTRINMVKP